MKTFIPMKYIAGIVGLVVVLGVGMVVAMTRHGEAAVQTTVAAGPHVVTQAVTATGQVQAKDTTTLAFATGGVVNHVYVNKGDQVKAGQLLATLDASDVAALRASANATLLGDQATANVQLQNALSAQAATSRVNAAAVASAKQKVLDAQLALRTAQDIFTNVDADDDIDTTSVTYITAAQTLVVAKNGLNEAQVAYQAAQTQVNQAATTTASAVASAKQVADLKSNTISSGVLSVNSAQVAYQNAVLRKSVLRAPAAGTIATTSLEVGQYAGSGQAVATLLSPTLQISTQVSEHDVAQLKVGLTADVTLDAFGSEVFPAKIVSLDPAATLVNGVNAYGVTLEFTHPDERIKAGMTANISVSIMNVQAGVAVPDKAVVLNGDQSFVFVPQNNGTQEKRAVQTGVVGTNGFVQIVSGLSAGDQVVSFGSTSVH